jgi:GntR family transcriptional repressor for pyruvate dehydrogenase complex
LSDNIVTSGSRFDSPIERKKVYELVADRLLADIRERRLSAGDALPTERELTGTYRVGRSSVREALRMLESRGLIQSGDSGTFVVAHFRPLSQSLHLLVAYDEANVHELYEMRRLLEGEFAALAAKRRSDAHLGRMTLAIEEMARSLTDEDAYIASDLRFHVAVAEASGNRVALHLMDALRGLLHDVLGSIFHVPGSPEGAIQEHRTIVAAIAAGDAHQARTAMDHHLDRVELAARQALVRDGREE